MPGSLAITTSNLQSVKLTIDGGTKPGATGHYKITRKANAASTYLRVFTTELAVVHDHPRPRSPDGTQLLWDYKVHSYITASSSYDSGIEDDNSGSGFGIAEIDATATAATTYIDPSGVAEPTIKVGGVTSTISNTYLAQAEVISYPDNAYDRDSWTVTKVIPLAASSA